ncbi:hypothetical protein ACQKWADRAFT_216373 [Trichoderma austrokoningii]
MRLPGKAQTVRSIRGELLHASGIGIRPTNRRRPDNLILGFIQQATPLEAASRACTTARSASIVGDYARTVHTDETTRGMEACCSTVSDSYNRVGLAYIGREARPGMRGNVMICHNLSFAARTPRKILDSFLQKLDSPKWRAEGRAEPTPRATRVLGSSSHDGDHTPPSCVSDSPQRENGLTPARLRRGRYENSHGGLARRSGNRAEDEMAAEGRASMSRPMEHTPFELGIPIRSPSLAS